MKHNLMVLCTVSAAAMAQVAMADEYVTPSNLTTYTLESLSRIPESGVVSEGDKIYVMNHDVTISAFDDFSFEGVNTLKMADGVTLSIEGYASLLPSPADASARVLVTRTDDEAKPKGIYVKYDSNTEELVQVANIDFEYAALRFFANHTFDIRNCTFRYANGALTSTAALTVGATGSTFYISDCIFEDNEVPAIGGAANYACGLHIEDCTFTNNNTQNTNKPQLNLTVGGDRDVVVKNCVLTGSGLNMVGGIAVGNLVSLQGSNSVVIEGCTITDHRYGLTGIGAMNMQIRNNTFKDNNHEDNAMNGGSGISLAGYGLGLDAIISGNHIENSLWGITLIKCNNVNIGQVDNEDSPGNNVFVNNGNGGVQYDLYNNQENMVYAQNNTWSVPEQTAEEIEKVIYHYPDNDALGEVIFMPAKEADGITAVENETGVKLVGNVLQAAGRIEVYDVSGRCVAVSETGRADVSSLTEGVYVARTSEGALKFTKK